MCFLMFLGLPNVALCVESYLHLHPEMTVFTGFCLPFSFRSHCVQTLQDMTSPQYKVYIYMYFSKLKLFQRRLFSSIFSLSILPSPYNISTEIKTQTGKNTKSSFHRILTFTFYFRQSSHETRPLIFPLRQQICHDPGPACHCLSAR